jgi:hypothetical protein
MKGAVIRRNRPIGALAIVLSLLTLSAVAFLVAIGKAELMTFVSYLFWPAVGALAAYLKWWAASERPAELVADAQGVHIDGRLVRSRRSLHRALILPRPGKSTLVELRRAYELHPLRVTLPTPEDARAFVRGLGLDSRIGMTVITGFGKSVVIADDGIEIEGPFQKEFVRYGEIAQLAPMPPTDGGPSPGFWFRTRLGVYYYVRTRGARVDNGVLMERDPFFAAVAGACAAAREAAPAARVALLRGARGVRDWLASLRAMDAGDFRSSAMSDDDLVSLLANANAPDELRAGAAARLATRDKERLRVASEGVAAPKVRVAIDAALAEDEAALEKALEESSSG